MASGAVLTLTDGAYVYGEGIGQINVHAGSTLDIEPDGQNNNNDPTLDGVSVNVYGAFDVMVTMIPEQSSR